MTQPKTYTQDEVDALSAQFAAVAQEQCAAQAKDLHDRYGSKGQERAAEQHKHEMRQHLDAKGAALRQRAQLAQAVAVLVHRAGGRIEVGNVDLGARAGDLEMEVKITGEVILTLKPRANPIA